MYDIVGVPSEDPDSCLFDAVQQKHVDYMIEFTFPDDFQDYTGAWHEFEHHNPHFFWWENGEARTLLFFVNSGNGLDGDDMGPYAW